MFPQPVTISEFDARAITQAAMDALRAGDPHRARAIFERLVASDVSDAPIYLGLATACLATSDSARAAAALDRVLAVEPNNVGALIMKADLLASVQDARAAAAYFKAAIESAPPPEQCSPEMIGALQHASRQVAHYADVFRQFIHGRLRKDGMFEEDLPTRFRNSIDILVGTKQVYYQEPRHYYFPELPQVQFFDVSAFPWISAIEAATPVIRAELTELLKDESAFRPYVETLPGRPRRDQGGMLENPDWGAYYLWKHGQQVLEHAVRCPRTMHAVSELPLCRLTNRAPSVLFSRLRAGARIPAHTGEINTRLICHLPLIVPDGCGFRVGNETRSWVEGKAWVFDDTIEHEAWNRSDRDRVVLLFEIWRPELTDAERRLVSALFEAVDAYGATQPASSL